MELVAEFEAWKARENKDSAIGDPCKIHGVK